MTNARRRAVPVIFALVAAGCAPGAPAAANTDADVKAIAAVRDRELALFANTAALGDSIRALYTDDIDFMPPGEQAVEGLDNVTKWAQAMFSSANVSGKYNSSRVTVSGDIAIDRYTATLTATPKAGGPATDEMIKGIHMLKRQADGGWKIAIDAWNPDKPETPPPAPATNAAPKKK